ncbi:MAG: hypothetical protein ACI8V2_000598 [Candidatus Latescibacterota bacterium]|jgi:hypothetical protein
MVWDEKKKAYVRKQKWEKVPWKKRESQVNGDIKWVAPNKTDAEKLLAERLSQLNKGEFVEPSNKTFREFKGTWLEKYANGEVRPTTLDQYTSLYKNHIISYLGDKKLSQIGVEDIQGFKSKLQEKGLGGQMVKHNLRLVRQMLNHAVDWGYWIENLAKKVRYPWLPKGDKQMEENVLPPSNVRLFLQGESPKYVQKQLRHASIDITFDRYGHFFLGLQPNGYWALLLPVYGGWLIICRGVHITCKAWLKVLFFRIAIADNK